MPTKKRRAVCHKCGMKRCIDKMKKTNGMNANNRGGPAFECINCDW